MRDSLPPGGPWIRVRDLGFSHGSRAVLENVRIDLFPGRHYIIAGPNGAGKSTLLDLLARLKRPAAGHVDIAGRPVEQYDPEHLAKLLALAPQDAEMGFSFSIREVVAMGRRPYLDRWGRLGAEDWRAVDQAIADVNLCCIAHQAVTTLSGGERRRCVVARTLAQATPIVLLDEPTAGLDIAQALAVMAVAKRLAERGSLVITVSHDLNLAACFGHEFVFLKNGRIAAAGPVGETFTDRVLSSVYDTGARVRHDDFAGGPAVSFRES